MNYLLAQWTEHIKDESWIAPKYSINAGYNIKSIKKLAEELSKSEITNRVEVFRLPVSSLCEYIKGEKIK
tara:strand:- start:1602 stop:1811 length:210 start_codon:yes stop_codon:yes gene_type:complete